MPQGILHPGRPEEGRFRGGRGRLSVDIKHLLKVYNYINDEKRPKVNLKFLGVFVAFAVAGASLVAFAIMTEPRGQATDPASSKKTEYVGLSSAEVASGLLGAQDVEARFAAWEAAHPEAEIDSKEPVHDGGRLVGYEVTYH